MNQKSVTFSLSSNTTGFIANAESASLSVRSTEVLLKGTEILHFPLFPVCWWLVAQGVVEGETFGQLTGVMINSQGQWICPLVNTWEGKPVS